jgi:cytochrome c biogenesis protein CcdA
VYNLAFVTPLLAVVLITHFGVSSTRIARWFSRRVAIAKVLMGAVFALLGAAIWLV